MVQLLYLLIMVFNMHPTQSRAKNRALCPPRLYNQRLELRFTLAQTSQVIVKQQNLTWLQLLYRMQPTQINYRLSDQNDKSHAVRGRYTFTP